MIVLYRGDSNRIEALELIDKKGEAVLICPKYWEDFLF